MSDTLIDPARERDLAMLKDQQERAARTVAPAPVVPPGMPDPRFPGQTVVHLNPPARVNGAVPEVDGRSEAEILNDPKRRLAALERENVEIKRRLAAIEDVLQRQLGPAANVEGEVYR